MALHEPYHEFPCMVDNTPGQVDEGEAERLHPFRGPRFVKHQLLHRRIKIKGQDHDRPLGWVLSEVGRRGCAPALVPGLFEGDGLKRKAVNTGEERLLHQFPDGQAAVELSFLDVAFLFGTKQTSAHAPEVCPFLSKRVRHPTVS